MKARWILLVAAFTLFVAVASAVPDQIHMTWKDDPRYTIVISWRTQSEEASIVEYGVGLPYDQSETGSPAKIHHVSLTGLLPDTTYHYRCGDGVSFSEDLTFHTAPEDRDHFSFVAFGDSRTNWATWGSCSEGVYQSGAEFVLHNGDLVSSGGDQAEWDIWFEEGKDMLSHRVMMPAIGNHENNDPKYYALFELPNNEDWYSFDYGNAHFIALTTEKTMTGAQREWLENDLASTNATWIFANYHRPMYSSSSHGCERSVYEAWGDLFDKYHVDMVFNGHDHCYERSYPMYDDWLADPPENGTVHIVCGGAGAPLYDAVSIGPWSAHFLKANHFVLITVNGTELYLEARLPDQTVFDTLALNKARLPDLVIDEMEVDPLYPIPGTGGTLKVSVSNRGKIPSGASLVEIQANGTSIARMELGALGVGESLQVEVPWSPAIAGTYNISAFADPEDSVSEGLKEDNNGCSMTVVASTPKVDLAVTGLEILPVMPSAGDEATLRVDVENLGRLASGSFEVRVTLGGLDLLDFTASGGLGPGQTRSFEASWTCESGDWELVVHADPTDAIDEVLETNNREARQLHLRDLMKVGPAYLPQGFSQGETVIVYYNQTEGEIPETCPTCVAVWGMNGWDKPPSSATPPGTVTRTLFETNMLQVGGGLWMAALPTTEAFDWIDLKFEDRQILSKYLDSNNGSNWVIPSAQWAVGRGDELLAAIADAEAAGVDVTGYRSALEGANASLQEGRYLEAAQVMMKAADDCRHDECSALLAAASKEYDQALREGLDLSRVESFLTAATSQLDNGNYYGSKSFSLKALEFIAEARAKVGEPAFVFLVLASLSAALGIGRRSPR